MPTWILYGRALIERLAAIKGDGEACKAESIVWWWVDVRKSDVYNVLTWLRAARTAPKGTHRRIEPPFASIAPLANAGLAVYIEFGYA